MFLNIFFALQSPACKPIQRPLMRSRLHLDLGQNGLSDFPPIDFNKKTMDG